MPTPAAIYRSWLLALCLFAVIVSVAGCKSDGSCEELFEVLKECDESFKEGEETFLQTCRQQAGGQLYKGYLKCSVNEQCVDYQKCVTAASNEIKAAERAKQLKDGIAAIQKNIESGAFRNADGACKTLLNKEDMGPELVTLCNGLAGKAVENLQRKLTQLRDSGGGEGFFGLCYDHKYFARKLGDPAHQAALRLCKEVDVARTVTRAVSQAKAKLEKKDNQLPFDCGLALKDLKNITSI
ncbi:MAG TPA: hypothetical protein EYN66_16160 [Myxococcales bacterium]|nr:hypothetical protein [Myxococcales bacterium]